MKFVEVESECTIHATRFNYNNLEESKDVSVMRKLHSGVKYILHETVRKKIYKSGCFVEGDYPYMSYP